MNPAQSPGIGCISNSSASQSAKACRYATASPSSVLTEAPHRPPQSIAKGCGRGVVPSGNRVMSTSARSLGTTSEVFDGSIDLVIGPMFSGKTTELIRRVRRNVAASKKCLLVKYKGDNRYTDDPVLSTHDHNYMEAKAVSTLSEISNTIWHYDIIAIDEGQFFPGDCGYCLMLLCKKDRVRDLELAAVSVCRSCRVCRAVG